MPRNHHSAAAATIAARQAAHRYTGRACAVTALVHRGDDAARCPKPTGTDLERAILVTMSKPSRWLVAVAVVALSVLGGWYAVNLAMGRLADNSAGWLDSLEPVHGQWVSRTGFAEDGSTPWTTPVRVTVDGDELRFDAGCNRLSAIVTVEDHRLHSEQGVVATEIGCPPEVAATEAWLVALVADSAQVQLKGSTEGDMFSLNTDAGWIGFLRDPGPATRAVDSVAGANRRCARGAVRCVLNTGSHQWLHRVVHPGTPQIGRVDRRR